MYPGIATSRSFGDYFAHRIGVVSEPTIGCVKLVRQNEYLCIACAAVWNVMTPKELFAFVSNNKSKIMGEVSK